MLIKKYNNLMKQIIIETQKAIGRDVQRVLVKIKKFDYVNSGLEIELKTEHECHWDFTLSYNTYLISYTDCGSHHYYWSKSEFSRLGIGDDWEADKIHQIFSNSKSIHKLLKDFAMDYFAEIESGVINNEFQEER